MSARKEDSDNESTEGEVSNAFANDGSFLEMFKRRMEEQKRKEKEKESKPRRSEQQKSPTDSATAKTTTITTKPVSSALSTASGAQKTSVNKPYQVVCSSITFHTCFVLTLKFVCDGRNIIEAHTVLQNVQRIWISCQFG